MYAPFIVSWVLPRAARQHDMPSSISSCNTGKLLWFQCTASVHLQWSQDSCNFANQRYFSIVRAIYPVQGTFCQLIFLPITLDKYPVLGMRFWLCECTLQADHCGLAIKRMRTNSFQWESAVNAIPRFLPVLGNRYLLL